MIELPDEILIRQRAEPAEFLRINTNNLYQAFSSDQKVLLSAVEVDNPAWEGRTRVRQSSNGWKKHPLVYRNGNDSPFLRATHPVRWFLDRVELNTTDGKFIGAIQARFKPFYRAFDIENDKGKILLSVSTSLFSPWTYIFRNNQRDFAILKKEWKGLLKETLTSEDSFKLNIVRPGLDNTAKLLVVASAIYIDLKYFNKPLVKIG